jgi:hypothetical protein
MAGQPPGGQLPPASMMPDGIWPMLEAEACTMPEDRLALEALAP